jgi:uncharacterized protein
MIETSPRLLEPPRRSFFLFGPRGTGKSFWLRERLRGACFFDLLDERLHHRYLADPGSLADELRVLERGSTVVLDEVQRLPGLLNTVHRFIEERDLVFALCGSSARKLRRAGTNLLAGRAVRRAMHPFVPEELGVAFKLDEAMRWGSLPLVLASEDRADVLDAYVHMYLREEIQAEAIVRNLGGFARFLPVAALLHGQNLNVSSLARDAGVSRTTVQGYIEVLEDTLLAYRLPAFAPRLRVREKKGPKLYWVDAGLVRGVKGNVGPVAMEERGALFEGWVAGLLRAYRDYRKLFDDWAYWSGAGSGSTEVDFVLRVGDRYVAVEAKAAARLDGRALRGLRAFAALPGLARRVVVYTGPARRRTEDGIDILPVAAFLEELESGELTGAAR